MPIPTLPLILVAALQAANSAGAPTAAQARATIVQARLAVEGDSAMRVRGRWLRAASRRPADPLATLGLATLARLSYAYPEALQRYSQASALPVVGTYALLGRGLLYSTRWQLDSAALSLNRALNQARATRDAVAEAEALASLSRIYSRTAGADSALRMLQRAQALVPAQEKALLADVRCLSSRLSAIRNSLQADSAAAAAVMLAEQSGDLRVLGRCLHVQASVLEIRGQQARASGVARRAVEVLDRARDLDGGSAAMQFLAYHSIAYSFEFAGARTLLDSAIARGQRVQNPLTVAWAQLNLAQLAQRLGDARASTRLTTASSQVFTRMGDRFGEGAAAILLADAATMSGRLNEAQTLYRRADSLMTRFQNVGARAAILMKKVRVLRELGRTTEAQAALEEAVRIGTAMRFDGIVNTDQYYEHGMLNLIRGENAQAVRDFELFRTHLGNNALHYHYDAQARVAEALTGLGRLSAADSVLRQVAGTAALLRDAKTQREAQVAVLDSWRFDFDTDLGFATIISRFSAAGQHQTALRIAEDRRARYLWTAMMRRHALQADSLQSIRGSAARMLSASELDVSGLARLLPESTALLEYVTGRGGEPTTLLVITRSGFSSYRLPPADSLINDISTFVAALEAGASPRGVARRLGATLLGPALPQLNAIQKLVVVPDGPIYRVPFDALETSAGITALQRFTISISPSARIAAAGWQNPQIRRSGTVLALGDPTFARSAELPRLPGSGREARAVTRGIRGARTLLGRNASEAALTRSDLRAVRVLHLATHAEVEDFGLLRSALALAPGGGEDGHVGVTDIAALNLNADLVVLSGCRTAGGVVVTGEGIQGLVAPFLEAGARSVVATQWAVGDRSIVPLMSRFYNEMKAGNTVGEALRMAKLAARESGAPASVWAALALTGDAQVRPLAER